MEKMMVLLAGVLLVGSMTFAAEKEKPVAAAPAPVTNPISWEITLASQNFNHEEKHENFEEKDRYDDCYRPGYQRRDWRREEELRRWREIEYRRHMLREHRRGHWHFR